MAFTGEREFIHNHLDYLWSLMGELVEEKATAAPKRQSEIVNEYNKLKREYDGYFKRLGELTPRYKV